MIEWEQTFVQTGPALKQRIRSLPLGVPDAIDQ